MLFKKQSNALAIWKRLIVLIYICCRVFLLTLSLLGSNLIVFTGYKFHTNTIVGKLRVYGDLKLGVSLH